MTEAQARSWAYAAAAGAITDTLFIAFYASFAGHHLAEPHGITGFAIGVAAIAWPGLIAGCLAWLSILVWVPARGRALPPSRAVLLIPKTVAPAHRREA